MILHLLLKVQHTAEALEDTLQCDKPWKTFTLLPPPEVLLLQIALQLLPWEKLLSRWELLHRQQLLGEHLCE
jgi:hypothetical protein